MYTNYINIILVVAQPQTAKAGYGIPLSDDSSSLISRSGMGYTNLYLRTSDVHYAYMILRLDHVRCGSYHRWHD